MTKKLNVGYEGIEGNFTFQAVQELFKARQGAFLESKPLEPVGLEMEELLLGLKDGSLDSIVLPIENSIVGTYYPVLDLILSCKLSIIGEFEMQESQYLLALPGVTLSEITEIQSHRFAIDQCQAFLQSRLIMESGKKIVLSKDTASSCQQIAKNNWRNVGALASKEAADRYGLTVVASGSSLDHGPVSERAVTRYVLLSLKPLIPERHLSPRTSLHVILKNEIGAMTKALTVFSQRNIGVAKIESRPSSRSIALKKAWEYSLYIDLDIGLSEHRMEKAIDNLKEFSEVTVMGSYPRYQTNNSEPIVGIFGIP